MQRVQSPRQAFPRQPWWSGALQGLEPHKLSPVTILRQVTPLIISLGRQVIPLGQTALSLSQIVGSPRWHIPMPVLPRKQGLPLPNRKNSPQGSSSLEEPNPKWVINLSSKPLTKAQRSVLAKGPNFVVSPKHPPNLEYITAIEAACIKLSQQDAEELRADINWVLRASHPPKPNLTKAQNLALRELKKDKDHTVLTADKGVAMVIMDRQDYVSKANSLLSQNTYRSIPWDPTNTIKNKLINILKRVKSQTGLNNQTYKAMYPTGCIPQSSMAYLRSTSQIPH